MDAAEVAKRLAALEVSRSGFLFDPRTGHTYTLNETAQRLLELFKDGRSEEEIVTALAEEFEVNSSTVERDLYDFFCQLNSFALLKE
ncbi:MAG: HPr-rel-A system PqqD family peptide chaperone [Proteobacteria bacterium]|nr:HPr-rel-A system PqqD family peptide chaperone [Pseudomonadota bacterium]MBU1741761.1 HPr-rel-A system PqqD family peptide chaperone [Pseudomonadota bacterium]